MSGYRGTLRQFFVPERLSVGQTVSLPKDLTHRLAKVLRQKEGGVVALCDNLTGRYRATLGPACRTAHVEEQLARLDTAPPLILWLVLPKREAWETALRQATELGATAIQPLTGRFGVVSRLNVPRAEAILVEAAEQSERLSLPSLYPLQSLEEALEKLAHPLWWANEAEAVQSALPQTLPHHVLVGPEGGFSAEEHTRLNAHPQVQGFSLGPHILRVDTAVASALTLAAHHLRQKTG